MSSDSGPEEEVHILEDTEHCASYGAASVASCKWVTTKMKTQDKFDPSQLRHYKGDMERTPGYCKIVGVGLVLKDTPKKKPCPGEGKDEKEVTPLVRLDIDYRRRDEHGNVKGIHFNAVQRSNDRAKLAAIIDPSLKLTENQGTALYYDYLKAIENRSPQFIWEWWSTGSVPKK